LSDLSLQAKISLIFYIKSDFVKCGFLTRMGDMDDMVTGGFDVYNEYRKYLLQYHEALERVKLLESVRQENDQLRTESTRLKEQVKDLDKIRVQNEQLSRKVRDLEMDKTAAHNASKIESDMLRVELRRLRKAKARKSKKSIPATDPLPGRG